MNQQFPVKFSRSTHLLLVNSMNNQKGSQKTTCLSRTSLPLSEGHLRYLATQADAALIKAMKNQKSRPLCPFALLFHVPQT